MLLSDSNVNHSIAKLAMFTVTVFDCCGYVDSETFHTVEDAQYALQRLYDAEELRSSLSRRGAIAQLEEQLEEHFSTLNYQES